MCSFSDVRRNIPDNKKSNKTSIESPEPLLEIRLLTRLDNESASRFTGTENGVSGIEYL